MEPWAAPGRLAWRRGVLAESGREALIGSIKGRLPTRDELANVVYHSSFGFRADRRSAYSSPLIRASRFYTAQIVVNRARQGMCWGGARCTESRQPPPRSGSSWEALSRSGNQIAYDECLAVADESLTYSTLPMDDLLILEGAQFYRHLTSRPRRAWLGELYWSVGPIAGASGVQKWLGIYLDRDRVRRAIASTP